MSSVMIAMGVFLLLLFLIFELVRGLQKDMEGY